ncbi:arginine N-methyltransferase 2-like [Hibiscus syriacus]|uniref:Arginine N-methyltransferase 2-like n=1 Tax=Hibiscus syriacus TaxID=106335 RepID=A0A6A3BN55_HIBSY|nr:arginine N-methyltransferase 2-like [Hibiscus syriacus]
MLESAGKDATKEFNDLGHSKTAKNLVFKYRVGVIQGYSSNNNEHFQVASTEEPMKRDTSAFVIRDEHKPKFASLLEFIIPLLVAASYFCYRYLTRGS